MSIYNPHTTPHCVQITQILLNAGTDLDIVSHYNARIDSYTYWCPWGKYYRPLVAAAKRTCPLLKLCINFVCENLPRFKQHKIDLLCEDVLIKMRLWFDRRNYKIPRQIAEKEKMHTYTYVDVMSYYSKFCSREISFPNVYKSV